MGRGVMPFTPIRPEGFVQGLIDAGYAQTSRAGGHVSCVKHSHRGVHAWYHARMNPARTETLTQAEMAEFRALGGPTAGPGWDGRPPWKPEPEPFHEPIYPEPPCRIVPRTSERPYPH